MKMAALVSLAILAAAHAPALRAEPLLFVANQGDRTVSVIDPVAAREIATIPENGITAHELAAAGDGRTLFVPIYGDSGVGSPGTDGRWLEAFDVHTRKQIGQIDFGHGVRPHLPVFDPVSGLLYVTTELDHSVTIVDPRSLTIVGAIPTGQAESHMLAISRDGSRGYTSAPARSRFSI